MKSIPMALVAAAMTLLTLAVACTTEKTVYVLPDGTEVTPTAAQATQAAGGDSQTAAPQSSPSKSASENAAPAPSQAVPVSAPAVNQRWNDKRNTLCSSLGLDTGVCEKIALNQTQLDGDEQDIDLPDEPDATPVPIDHVGDAVEELQEIVAVEGEVSIQVLTYTESLIQQAADAVVQAEQELANQEATAAYLDAKKQELQELRQTYAQLLERIGVAQDRSLALAEQIEQEHLAFSIERANGEALIRYKDARLAHTNALAEAEKNAVAQIDAIASVNDAASEIVAERIDLAPLYKKRDEAQEAYDAAVQRFEGQVHQYEKNWLDVYEVYIADPAVRDQILNNVQVDFPRYKTLTGDLSANEELEAYHCPFDETYRLENYSNRSNSYYCGPHPDINILVSGITPSAARKRGELTQSTPQSITLFRKELDAAEQEITRAVALNEKDQSVAEIERVHTSSIGTAVSNARLAVVDAYREHGISEGRAGAIFRFTDSGEDAVTYNLSLAALNRDAAANREEFQSILNAVLDTLDADIRVANDARANALDAAEDARYARADTIDEEEQRRVNWQISETIRRRTVLMDALMMSAGWGHILRGRHGWTGEYLDSMATVPHEGNTTTYVPSDDKYRFNTTLIAGGILPGWSCLTDLSPPFYKTVTGIGRDKYIRQYWHREQPLDRTYTTERLEAVESVVDKLEQWLQDTADRWWDEHEQEYCDAALESFKAKKQEIVSENPLPTD